VFALTWLSEYAVGFADYKRVAFGLALVVIMSLFPEGLLAGLLAMARRAWSRSR
jgi:ABC-type branched-subunit amino acid transport system permease subunit